MAKGNDGNYLQHCVEVEAAVRLAKNGTDGRLHVALTHGMSPFESLGEPNGNAHKLLYCALWEAAGESFGGERTLVRAYRECWESQGYCPNYTRVGDLIADMKKNARYPNTAELMRAIIETENLSGGIAETDPSKHGKLAEAWPGSRIAVANSSWRKQLGPDGVLCCPDRLDMPWLFSMDPMTYTEDGREDGDKLHRSDLDRLAGVLERYFDSGQPGIASLFVYRVGTQNENPQRQFRFFMDDLATRLSAQTCSYWVTHRGGNLNLAGLLFSDEKLANAFDVPKIERDRRRKNCRHGELDVAPKSQVGLHC